MRFNKRIAALAMAGAATISALVGTTPASAATDQVSASGNTTFQFGAPFLKPMTNNNCGALFGSGTGGAQAFWTNNGKLKLIMPISGAVQNPDTGAIRLVHSGGIVFENSCYELRLTNFYIQNFGDSQSTVFDVLAKTKANGDNEGRTDAFSVDLTNANITCVTRPNSSTLKARGADLLLGEDGAPHFNGLVTGDPNTGPYYAGELIGKARTSIRNSSGLGGCDSTPV